QNGARKIFGYAGKNGQAYHSIGKFLIRNGDISQQDMSLQAIRTWLENHPQKAEKLLWKNPSYVFFRRLKEPAPVGSMNVMLTPGRSVAVDPQYVPLGMPLWLDLESSPTGLRRLVIAQDTGTAIKGRVRADVYWGIGKAAARKAGPMKDRGRYYFLVPKVLASRILANHIPATKEPMR
ncbi:MAG: murein transglycosylase, partial [Alphaproteobacteria bacterium]|nr:murein transglycosylase [Alphaproteobacteria bacterium]